MIIFRRANAGSGRHYLHVARLRPSLVAEAVLMADRAFTNIGDDFHVAVRMRRKAGVRGDDIVVPDAKASPVHPVRILVVRKGELMLGIQPAMIFPAKAFKWDPFDHLSSPPSPSSLVPPFEVKTIYP